MSLFILNPFSPKQDAPHDPLVNFNGTTGNDYIVGNAQDNRIVGGGGHDLLLGGAGNDTLKAGHKASSLYGGAGDDLLIGGRGSDHLNGGDGEDRLNGRAGDDILVGGPGLDWLVGGPGRDTFLYRDISDSIPESADWIVDFVSGKDKIDLSALTHGSGLTYVEKFTGQSREAVLGYDLTVDFDGDGVADFRVMTVGQAVQTDIVA
ncbi:M10 family metallopeptidase C-terminal domain-containing protein [Pseudomonas asplenii]|uniref:M10 family metallopeptidase C-terminal domain-containing protein n=1 Tax=Pseudomonas asplenii TaxID=53407 RepID=UPI00235F7820|nr:M10 family metallopeptidase C-terminal domain-containing protein [Pseudomonas asplenii]